VSSGLLGSVQNLFASLLGLARTRLDLLSTELQEALAHFALGIIIAGAAVLLATLGLAFAGAAFVLVVAPDQRLFATVIIALVFLAAGAGLGMVLRVRKRPRIFEASIGELQRDQDTLAP
jgi:uncharacterized membrane protein YqjE